MLAGLNKGERALQRAKYTPTLLSSRELPANVGAMLSGRYGVVEKK